MTHRKDIFLGLGIAGATLILILLLAVFLSYRRYGDTGMLSSGGEKVAVVELFGPIYESRAILRELKQFGEIRSVKAVLLRIDSPGGGVAAAQEIYEGVKRLREAGKPVVVSMGSVAASGGYYVACGADSIVANPGTTTGSIGVIAEFPNVRDFLDRVGIRFETVVSGRYKRTGSPYHDMTEPERRILQSWVDDAYKQFVEVVVKERNLPRQDVLRIADGRVLTGSQAHQLGLIDCLGDYEEAVRLAARMGGIEGEPNVVRLERRRSILMDRFFRQIEGFLRGMNGVALKYVF